MAQEGDLINWASEDIPDRDTLYMRVHETFRKNSGAIPAAFKNHGRGMSTDWDKYSTAEETRDRAREPARNAVVAMGVGEVGRVPGQCVEHTPDAERRNRAHTDVIGEKDEEVRVKLRRLATIVIPFDAPAD